MTDDQQPPSTDTPTTTDAPTTTVVHTLWLEQVKAGTLSVFASNMIEMFAAMSEEDYQAARAALKAAKVPQLR